MGLEFWLHVLVSYTAWRLGLWIGWQRGRAGKKSCLPGFREDE